ncbi:MAG TPA: amidohydrolase family protein [Flavitalea sp.]|nr:amidohydrolase family protein [Flavitalea sp.]
MISRFTLLILLFVTLIVQSCTNSRQTAAGTSTGDTFYSVDDFASVRKIDTHIHLNTDQPEFIEQATTDNIQFLDIVDDRPFGLPMNAQEKIAIRQIKAFPHRVEYATTFPVKDFKKDGWQSTVIDHLKSAIENGAIAVKVWKNVGMDLKDSSGKFVMIDNPAFDPILKFIAQKKIPLIGHLGEPRECWLPLNKMVLHKDYYREHPEYHMYLHPEYPSYEQQVQARDNMLEKHPDLIFIGAHLGSLEWSLEELAKRLDKYPDMYVDMARMSDLYLHAKNNWQGTRDFFIRYQNRLLYATDVQVNPTNDVIEMNRRIHEARIKYWTFFVSDETLNENNIGDFKGLRLPRQVVDKIYYGNAKKLFKGF